MDFKNVLRRWVDGRRIEDADALENIMYNDQAGAQKNVTVGPALKYIGAIAATTAIAPGSQLYLFKTSAGVGYITMDTVSPVVAGVAPAANVFPVLGQVFTLYSADTYSFIIGAADIHLYVMKDETGYRRNP